MRISLGALPGALARGLRSAYLVTGSEPLLILEACDLLREGARAAGYADREVHFVGRGFDWNALLADAANLSLFSARRLIELKLEGTPDAAATAALVALAKAPPADTLLLVSGELERKSLGANWVGEFEAAAAIVVVQPVTAAALPGWIRARLEQQGTQIDDDALELLAERVEGNLLAARQAVDRIVLLGEDARADLALVAAVVADSARYDIFELAAAAFDGRAERALHVLAGLRAEGVEPPLVLWALLSELRAASRVAQRLAQGQRIDESFAAERVWSSRQGPLRGALRRLDRRTLNALLHGAATADRIAKGSLKGDAWVCLESLVARIAGLKVAA